MTNPDVAIFRAQSHTLSRILRKCVNEPNLTVPDLVDWILANQVSLTSPPAPPRVRSRAKANQPQPTLLGVPEDAK